MLRFVSMVHESPAEEVRTRLAEASIDASPTTPEEFAAFIRAETERSLLFRIGWGPQASKVLSQSRFNLEFPRYVFSSRKYFTNS